MDRRSSTASIWVTFRPPTSIRPESGSTMRLIIRMVVVLPQPEGPISTQISPALMVSDSPSTADCALVPKVLVRRSSVIILETAVGRARVGRHGVGWQGETRQRAHARKEDQRSQHAPGRLNRACSALTRKVRLKKTKMLNLHANFP